MAFSRIYCITLSPRFREYIQSDASGSSGLQEVRHHLRELHELRRWSDLGPQLLRANLYWRMLCLRVGLHVGLQIHRAKPGRCCGRCVRNALAVATEGSRPNRARLSREHTISYAHDRREQEVHLNARELDRLASLQ